MAPLPLPTSTPRLASSNYFEGRLDGEFSIAPQMTIGVGGKAELLLCVRFIRGNRSMLAALQKKDWKTFARLYNGPAYAQNRYDEKLSKAYFSFSK